MIKLQCARALTLLVALGQPLDILTTNRALAGTGAHEGNPVEAWLMVEVGPLWWLPKALLAVFLAYQAVTLGHASRWTWALLAAGVKVYAVVLVANYWHLL